MPLNPAFIGRSYPPSRPYQVGRDKIREFASAVGDDNPAYHDVEVAWSLGHPDLIAPPTFPVIMTMKAMAVAMFDPDLGLDYSRVVHGEQKFVYSRPVYAGDSLVVTASIDNIRSVAGNDLITTRADVLTEGGEHVVTSYSVIVSRDTATPGQEG